MQHSDDHHEMVREMRAKWLWTNVTVMLLGLGRNTSFATACLA
jgi:hypothetical protein